MSTTQDHGDFVFQCDEPRCRETLATNTSNFEGARNALRRAAWKPYRMPGADDWRHRCNVCVAAREARQ
jgi:hypothetical protein